MQQPRDRRDAHGKNGALLAGQVYGGQNPSRGQHLFRSLCPRSDTLVTCTYYSVAWVGCKHRTRHNAHRHFLRGLVFVVIVSTFFSPDSFRRHIKTSFLGLIAFIQRIAQLYLMRYGVFTWSDRCCNRSPRPMAPTIAPTVSSCKQCSRIRVLRFFHISKNVTFTGFLK